MIIEVGGKRVEVVVPAGFGGRPAAAMASGKSDVASARRGKGAAQSGGGDELVTPMQGTIVKLIASEGRQCRPVTRSWCSRR